MNEFYARVYDVVALIPKGKVATYGQIAALLGNPKAARQVGYALRFTPADRDLPCHRVINAQGAMLWGSVFGSPSNQRDRLKKEGVIFKANGCVDMKQSLWMFD